MACSPHTCDNHDTGTTTCIGHRPACVTNSALTWYAKEKDIIYAKHIEELRKKIRDEISTWNDYVPGLGTEYNVELLEENTIEQQQVITHETFNNFDNMIGGVYGSFINDVESKTLIDDSDWDELIDRYNVIRQNCICNSDCSCNTVCACHGDCDCNY